jgi:hypothetical protein
MNIHPVASETTFSYLDKHILDSSIPDLTLIDAMSDDFVCVSGQNTPTKVEQQQPPITIPETAKAVEQQPITIPETAKAVEQPITTVDPAIQNEVIHQPAMERKPATIFQLPMTRFQPRPNPFSVSSNLSYIPPTDYETVPLEREQQKEWMKTHLDDYKKVLQSKTCKRPVEIDKALREYESSLYYTIWKANEKHIPTEPEKQSEWKQGVAEDYKNFMGRGYKNPRDFNTILHQYERKLGWKLDEINKKLIQPQIPISIELPNQISNTNNNNIVNELVLTGTIVDANQPIEILSSPNVLREAGTIVDANQPIEILSSPNVLREAATNVSQSIEDPAMKTLLASVVNSVKPTPIKTPITKPAVPTQFVDPYRYVPTVAENRNDVSIGFATCVKDVKDFMKTQTPTIKPISALGGSMYTAPGPYRGDSKPVSLYEPPQPAPMFSKEEKENLLRGFDKGGASTRGDYIPVGKFPHTVSSLIPAFEKPERRVPNLELRSIIEDTNPFDEDVRFSIPSRLSDGQQPPIGYCQPAFARQDLDYNGDPHKLSYSAYNQPADRDTTPTTVMQIDPDIAEMEEIMDTPIKLCFLNMESDTFACVPQLGPTHEDIVKGWFDQCNILFDLEPLELEFPLYELDKLMRCQTLMPMQKKEEFTQYLNMCLLATKLAETNEFSRLPEATKHARSLANYKAFYGKTPTDFAKLGLVMPDFQVGRETAKKPLGKACIDFSQPNIYIILNLYEFSTFVLINPSDDEVNALSAAGEYGLVTLFKYDTDNHSVHDKIKQLFDNHQLTTIEEVNMNLQLLVKIVEMDKKPVSHAMYTMGPIQDEETTVKRFIEGKYTVDNCIDHRIKAAELYNALLEVVQVGEADKMNFRTRMSKYLKSMGLQKKRYSDGYYYYGLVERPVATSAEVTMEIPQHDEMMIKYVKKRCEEMGWALPINLYNSRKPSVNIPKRLLNIPINWEALSKNPSLNAMTSAIKASGQFDKLTIKTPITTQPKSAFTNLPEWKEFVGGSYNALDSLIKNSPEKIDWDYLCTCPIAVCILEKNPEKINWEKLCQYKDLWQCEELLTQNIDKIQWNHLSKNPTIHNTQFFKQHKDRFNWSLVSSSVNQLNFVVENADRIDWQAFQTNPHITTMCRNDGDIMTLCKILPASINRFNLLKGVWRTLNLGRQPTVDFKTTDLERSDLAKLVGGVDWGELSRNPCESALLFLKANPTKINWVELARSTNVHVLNMLEAQIKANKHDWVRKQPASLWENLWANPKAVFILAKCF